MCGNDGHGCWWYRGNPTSERKKENTCDCPGGEYMCRVRDAEERRERGTGGSDRAAGADRTGDHNKRGGKIIWM